MDVQTITDNESNNLKETMMIKIPLTLKMVGIAMSTLLVSTLLHAKDRVIVVSSANELQEGLNLDAVAQVFKESDSLQEFEVILNDPDIFVNNLDLNGDGLVDFIRVIEEDTTNGRLIILQAVLGTNAYTDVAYIDISWENGRARMQVRGEASLYGQHHYVVPRYYSISNWPIITFLFSPSYEFYHSPYSWDDHPHGWSNYNSIRHGLYRSKMSYSYHSNWFKQTYYPHISHYRKDHHHNHRHYSDHWKDHSRHRSHSSRKNDEHKNSSHYYRHDEGRNRHNSHDSRKSFKHDRSDYNKHGKRIIDEKHRHNSDRKREDEKNHFKHKDRDHKRISERSSDHQHQKNENRKREKKRDTSKKHDFRNDDHEYKSPSTPKKPRRTEPQRKRESYHPPRRTDNERNKRTESARLPSQPKRERYTPPPSPKRESNPRPSKNRDGGGKRPKPRDN